ncbi:uncharacterized protein BCR38DRAFT_416566 [Pseudomassariella vexata]|uniref:Uncharacterized protein n=1 Tax=Pseudomassariella vexata TaxID=1141098 RepID=A0A1Y2EIG2_9PEZI|nr:uncharacterized protein BCR38DRAFT_416566 [Pseudomassariella vexata]ORY71360.1 hypothetical protein BCR38DRAFT_416566 [Pseudomassariella vexata]
MIMNLKSVLLFSLVALSLAEPIPRSERDALETRAKKKGVTDVICPDGKRLAQSDVGSALCAARAAADESVGYPGLTWWYPHYFGNQPPIFGASVELRSFPIVKGTTFTGKDCDLGSPADRSTTDDP